MANSLRHKSENMSAKRFFAMSRPLLSRSVLLGAFVLLLLPAHSLLLSAPATAQTPPTSVLLGTPPQPNWENLSALQQHILEPLAQEWNTLDKVSQKTWLGIANRYPKMRGTEQQRIQRRMHRWSQMTPAQRAKVRGSYRDFRQLPVEQQRSLKARWHKLNDGNTTDGGTDNADNRENNLPARSILSH